ncbi:uncharacterized protein LOC119298451 [Triticum dicoccoides]|uniref:uncharacterized protein LOC119298451 n=1 Tax=Triticum dicoccoides TaxID=85692 RepID=UPI000E7C3978|nr:uncharacterized protein LOC119298451 [Triticum dicoccoides]
MAGRPPHGACRSRSFHGRTGALAALSMSMRSSSSHCTTSCCLERQAVSVTVSPPSPCCCQSSVLAAGFPTMSMDDDVVVYLLSKACSAGEMEVVIAVDLRKKTLRGVGKLVAGKDFTDTRNRTTEMSKYLSLNKTAGHLN